MVRELVVLPSFEPEVVELGQMPVYQYRRTLEEELADGRVTADEVKRFLECMMAIRAFEEMIMAVRNQAYDAIKGLEFEYRGPTHLSIGQEATSVGGCAALGLTDYITSTHRGHGDGIAKGCFAVQQRDAATLRKVLGLSDTEKLDDAALRERAMEEHLFRTAAELFGRDAGYCRGRGGGMHIADFSVGHLGANAIVGGSIGIAAGAGMSVRYRGTQQVCLCFAGDGAYCNGIAFEALNVASMGQFTNGLMGRPFGVPTIFAIINNQYAMTGQVEGEVTGVDHMARRGAAFRPDNLHAEVINGMDVLAVLDGIRRAVELARAGKGPVVRELVTYRYQGHSLSDPRTEYRSKEEEAAWREVDPLAKLSRQLVEAGVCTGDEIAAIQERVEARQGRATRRAAEAPEPKAEDVLVFMYSNGTSESVPAEAKAPRQLVAPPPIARKDGKITFKEAIKEALIEEMVRDNRVVFYGEDVADYGGAFKVTKGLIDIFGRERVFNTSISEAAIIGTAVGAAMTGLRPVVELMYSDFEYQAGDQIYNQAAKWSYMSGGSLAVPIVIRSSVGAGKGYGGQHSQALESHSTHTPGIKVVFPSTPYDVKGLLKTAIRDDNPVMFCESQALYNDPGVVPAEDYTVPFGSAAVRREGSDITLVSWGKVALDVLEAAKVLEAEHKISAEVIDPRTLIPFDIESVLRSVRKTGRAIVASQATRTGSYTAEIASQVQELAFDYLDAPVGRIGALDGVSPQSYVLEQAYLPSVAGIVAAARKLVGR
ncbi:MAG: pyruvate dehydrogenase [Planctomycetes bacterium]|nr:pyruvate dehydrogenase [Planctomycetota bacterium]